MTKNRTRQELTRVYHSPLGDIVLTSDGSALTELRFAEATNGKPAQDIPPLADTCRWLDLYFSGAMPDFTPRLAPQGTPFQQSVWRELLTIPYGQTVSYGHIAQRLHCRSAQAVGGAVGHNPIALIIPCHRVIGSNGHLTGYAYGLDRKQWLLAHETQYTGQPYDSK
ncbi:MAG: methylated-DNA--[Bacteroidales bacterium]|nr:methylated-DNA--[protein]-cysteine S-methyltransferase [Bacteroidales bacterium]